MGVSSMAARISGVLSPIVLLLENYWTPLPLIVFGICSILAGLLTLMLPETRKRPLPETLQDGETFEGMCKPRLNTLVLVILVYLVFRLRLSIIIYILAIFFKNLLFFLPNNLFE